MRFSERYGYKPVREIIQKESIDNDLKNTLWSLLQLSIFEKVEYEYQYGQVDGSNLKILLFSYWYHFFKKPIDTISSYTSDAIDILRKEFFKMPWHSIYSFIEITLIFYTEKVNSKQSFINSTNIALERECSAYRIINDDITPITSEQEIQSIEDALENTHPYTGIQQHLNQALKLMSDRQKPDYRNSIKESISAVESICKIVTDDEKATLGQALKIIESKYGLHEALKKSLSQLYGYTSDADGIRHAMLEESNLSYIDAKFMLVACTNFINYLIEKTTDQN